MIKALVLNWMQNIYVNCKYDCTFSMRKLLLMRNGDFKELGVWSCQIKEPKRYSYMVLYLTSMSLSLKYLSIISFNLCFSILKFCSSSYAKTNNRSPSFQVDMKGLDGILGASYVGIEIIL